MEFFKFLGILQVRVIPGKPVIGIRVYEDLLYILRRLVLGLNYT